MYEKKCMPLCAEGQRRLEGSWGLGQGRGAKQEIIVIPKDLINVNILCPACYSLDLPSPTQCHFVYEDYEGKM